MVIRVTDREVRTSEYSGIRLWPGRPCPGSAAFVRLRRTCSCYRPCANRDNSPFGVSPTGSPQTAAVAKRLTTLLRYAIRGEKDKSTYAGPSVSRQLSPFHSGNLLAKIRRRIMGLFSLRNPLIPGQRRAVVATESDTIAE